MTDPFIGDMSERLKAINQPKPKTMDESFSDFKKGAAKIKKKCEETSPASCMLGKCKFSKGMKCIFEEMNMSKPHQWNISRRKEE